MKSISKSKKLSKDITPEDSACLLYTWILPQLDVNGCYHADPRIVNGSVWPRRGHTDDFTGQCLKQLETSGLIVIYENDGDKFLWAPDFVDKQPHLNPEREGIPSILPPTPEQLKSKSGVTPDEVTVNVKLSKVKLSKVHTSSSDKTPTSEMFSVFIDLYSKQNGEKPKITEGKDGKIAKTLWLWCQETQPADPMGYFRARAERIWKVRPDIKDFGGIKYFWNWGIEQKTPPKKKETFIPLGNQEPKP